MYDFIAALNKVGCPAKVICNNIGGIREKLPQEYRRHLINVNDFKYALSDQDIVIYGDTTVGNPLGAKRVIRWQLNKPCILTGQMMNYGYEDLLYAYSTHIDDKSPQLFYLLDEKNYYESIRKNAQRRKDTVTFYFGKCFKETLYNSNEIIKQIVEKFDHVQIITRLHPESRADTLKMIGNSSLVVSFDPLTAIRLESQLMGVPVLMMSNQYHTQGTTFNIESNCEYYSVPDWENARDYDIDFTWNKYCEYIDGQKSMVKKWYLEVLEKFSMLEANPEKLVENAENNRRRAVSEYKEFRNESSKWEWVNVLEYNDIPMRILMLIARKMDNKMILTGKAWRIAKDRLKHGI